MSRKVLNEYFVNSKNIKVAKKYNDVALYSFINNTDSESMELGNYICMNRAQETKISSTESTSDEFLPETNLANKINKAHDTTTAQSLNVISSAESYILPDASSKDINDTDNTIDTLTDLSY